MEEQMKSQQRIQEKQKKVQELKQAVNTIKLSAQTAVEDSERIFTELISSMEKKRSEATELIRAQEKAELSRAERLLEQLEQEIADLQRRVTELEQLSHTHDHIHFLQALASGRQSPTHDRPDFHASGIAFHQHLSFDGVRNSLSDLKKRLEEFYEEEFNKIPPQGEFNIWAITPEEREKHDKQFDLFTHTLGYVSGVQVRKFFLQSGLPASVLAKIWELADMGEDGKMDCLEFSIAMKLITLKLQGHPLPTSLPIIMKQTPVPVMKSSERFDFCYLTLDLNTAHRNLILSEKNRAVRYGERQQQYSDHPERFDAWPQVLFKESVCGRCYWEVEWSSMLGVVSISASYKDISRKGRGDECRFGRNNQSWSLECSSFSSSLCFYHNNIKTKLRGPSPSRIGVYVDHSAGTLSFYSVSDTMKLLHRVHTTFTQPLYAGIGVGLFSNARLCDSE
ncbi:hypothetical protein PGIGA_G00194590 [Pangasianodon gigas]|uniref:Uncharacterized protein n=1 Tax=Pangasianodon gigas TaxID=30993 RepID=A0ACC5XXK7_PANGG|nr:hypothetical protein [Pangasianodon gigas]